VRLRISLVTVMIVAVMILIKRSADKSDQIRHLQELVKALENSKSVPVQQICDKKTYVFS